MGMPLTWTELHQQAKEGFDSTANPKQRLVKGWGYIPTPAQLFNPMVTMLRKL